MTARLGPHSQCHGIRARYVGELGLVKSRHSRTVALFSRHSELGYMGNLVQRGLYSAAVCVLIAQGGLCGGRSLFSLHISLSAHVGIALDPSTHENCVQRRFVDPLPVHEESIVSIHKSRCEAGTTAFPTLPTSLFGFR